ncbi:MAG: cytidylate kinase-like family protein [Clostridia bacterium]|nr:cytidylate kinase-like family protein [Clostridia bacterium]
MLVKELLSGLRKDITKKKTNVKKEEVVKEKESVEAGPVITIAREFGSGGREIAMKVSQKLKFDFYDKEKIIETAKKNGIDTSLFEQLDESKIDSFWYQVSPKEYDIPENSDSYEVKVNNDKMFMIQSDTIREIAQKGNAVFVGRCASYILRNTAKKVFITAGLEDKIKRVEKRYGLSRDKAINLIQTADKKRENYYDYYTNTKWNAPENYDLIIDVSKTGIDGAVNKIVKYVNENKK